MLLSVPYHHQGTGYTCGPASLQMVFEYFDLLESQHLLAKEAGTDQAVGTTTDHMIKTATKNGFFCFVNDNSSLHEIYHFLGRGLPAIVRFIEPSGDEDHYAVVTGLTRSSIILNDPWNGMKTRLSRKKFQERWHSEKHDHVGWLMVLSREPFQLGRQYFPQEGA